MTTFKYRDNGTWKTITLPSGVHVGPDQPDANIKQMWIDTDEPDATLLDTRVAALESVRLLDIRRLVGAGGGNHTIVAGGNFTVDGAGATPLRLSYTPPVNAWWRVQAHVGQLEKTDAAYAWGGGGLVLSPLDADGIGGGTGAGFNIASQHSGVQTYEPHIMYSLFKLMANTAYTCTAVFSGGGGTWRHETSPTHISIEGMAWAR